VTPEAERYLTKARLTLDHGRTMLTVDLTEDAGRAAYLAGYQAAEAFIFERTGKATKTHKGDRVPRRGVRTCGFITLSSGLAGCFSRPWQAG
jgi:hypothetical protein